MILRFPVKLQRNWQMKILVICQYYYPEPFRISDICEEMVKRGHEVTVVTGEPNYPEGEIYKGYENHQKSDEVINGVTVHRCSIIPRKSGSLYRFLNYFSYPRAAKKYVKRLGRFDIVFVNQLSPVMMAEPAIAYKKKYGTPIVMYCLDLWPESLVAGGIKRASAIYRIFHKISKKIYTQMDRILITSRMFRDYFKKEFCVENTEYLPQYAEQVFERIPAREHNGTNLLFAGNLGIAQSVETIINAAEKVKDVAFHIVGGGIELEKLKSLAGENVRFYGRRTIEEMPDFYAMADAMLVTLQADPLLSLTLPGKVQSYMAAGKPVIGAIDGETRSVIEEAACGYCGKAEDADGLAENINRFLTSEKKDEMGINARIYYENHFARNKFMDKLEEELRLYSTRE